MRKFGGLRQRNNTLAQLLRSKIKITRSDAKIRKLIERMGGWQHW
jgi:hypothetical protein